MGVVADDLWEPEPEGLRENPRELTTNGKERQKVLHPQPPSIWNVCVTPVHFLPNILPKIEHRIISTPLKLQFKKKL